MLAGKRCLVVGVANHRSIAWGVAQAWRQEGAEVVVSTLPRFLPQTRKLLASSWAEAKDDPGRYAFTCDVSDDASIRSLLQQVHGRFHGKPLHALLHAVAYAGPQAMRGAFLNTTREDFAEAHGLSSYSLVALAREAFPCMARRVGASVGGEGGGLPPPPLLGEQQEEEEEEEEGGEGGSSSIISLSYLGASRAVPYYKVMGPAKASLEASCRALAAELGPYGVRVNCLSPGPINTLSARGITGFTELAKEAQGRSPLRRRATIDDVGKAASFLASDGARAITGQTLYVDGGMSIMAP